MPPLEVSSDTALEGLRKIRALAEIPDPALVEAVPMLKWLKLSKKEKLVTHLAAETSVYFLISGKCRLALHTPGGRTIGFRRLAEGAHFGEIAALTGSPRTLDVTTVSDCVVAECPQDLFLSFMERYPKFASTVAISLARTVAGLTERMFELATLELRFRLYGELLRLAKEGAVVPEGVLIRDMPTQDMLASAIGAGREPVSKEIGFLKSTGLLKQKGRELLICDLDKIRRLMQERSGVAVSHVVDWPL
ncbi:Crp/Fnr family transcriptional regulator [Terricaulis sp.]|uniref:Crp/Fnr family transcriptional regulator n=1 Tax=Terricaulis sp. TaxID=2768686 RepID=UPI003782F8A1